MKVSISSNLTNRYSSHIESVARHGKRINGFIGKLLELMARKTESDKRVELFGSDPLK